MSTTRAALLLLLVSAPLLAQTLPEDLIRVHQQTWTALERARTVAREAVVQQPFETTQEWNLRQRFAAEDGSVNELQAWIAADTALRQAEFAVEAPQVVVKASPSKTKGRTSLAVTSKDPAIPFQQSVELKLAPTAVGSPAARLVSAIHPVAGGVYRTIVIRLELSGGALSAPLNVPVRAFWDFTAGNRAKPKQASLVDTVKVDGGGTIWLHNSGNGESPLTLKKGFLLQRTPVTQALYAQLTGKNPSRFAGVGEDWQRPVEMVNRNEARWFCNLLSQAEGLDPVYTFAPEATIETADETTFRAADLAKNGWRLPQDAEYFYAAAGGTKTKNFTFIGGEDPDLIAWWPVNAGGTTHPVGQKLPNELGLLDMGGNVVQWIESTNESNPIAGGTSWKQSYGAGSGAMPHLFADQSEFGHDFERSPDLGFRVARNLPGVK